MPATINACSGRDQFQMRINVKLFAILRDTAGMAEIEIDAPAGASARQIGALVAHRYPAMQPYLRHVAYAVNQAYVPADHLLQDGDELALIPPVSGG